MAERAKQKLRLSRQALEKELLSSGGEKILLTKARQEVLAQQPMELLKNLKAGNISAVQVLEAFQAKAIEESKRTNCITAFIPEAKQWAKELDANRTDASVKQMPLFGLPVSIKDMLSVKGMDTTVGLTKRVDHPLQEDAVCVQLFKSFGGVPFVMTNVPQLCMSFTCKNPVFGETVNPFDKNRTCGGSSGGEAALIGAGGSFLGLGTDIGGSVRMPANWCGIASLKPTARRATGRGLVTDVPPPVGVYGTMGIMGKDANIVVEAVKAYYSVDHSQFDAEIPPVPWRDSLFCGTVRSPLKKKLRIGYFTDLGDTIPTPGVMRAIKQSISVLKKLGHEVVPFQLPDMQNAIQLWLTLMMADGGRCLRQVLEGQEVEETIKHLMEPPPMPPKKEGCPDPKPPIENVTDLWFKLLERAMSVGQFTGAWKGQNLDLLLSPVWPIPAPPKGANTALMAVLGGYTFLYNLFDFPCAAVPVTKENNEDQNLLEKYSMKDEMLTQVIKQYTKGSSGMPIGVQFVALPFCEEMLCRIMVEFSKAVDYKA